MLKGSKAIVTGANRGIGLAIAKALAEQGCFVLLAGRNVQALTEAKNQIKGKVEILEWDVSDLTVASQKIEKAAEIMGGFDILVNNAGIFSVCGDWSKKDLLNTTVEGWETVMKTNSSAIFFNMQAAVKYMLAHEIKGNILNISSVAGLEPVYGAYGASKISALGLTRGWGKMFADDGITINGIAPGPVATDMNQWKPGDSLEHPRIPYGRFALAEEIAQLALHLLSVEGQMICGETVVLDGGYSIR